jgi:hypothetical protein
MGQRTNIRTGMAVMSHDGVQVGRVIHMDAEGIVIEKGQFFLRDFRVPLSDISMVRGDDILLVRDYAALRRMDTHGPTATAKGTVGVGGYAAPPPQGGLGLGPNDLTQARMDSAKFQDHGRYDLHPTGSSATLSPPVSTPMPARPVATTQPPVSDVDTPAFHPAPHEPALAERRAAGPGWDPLSVDEEEQEKKKAPLTGGPDTELPTRY